MTLINLGDDAGQTEARENIKELCELDSGLSEWEVEFVEQMSHWFGKYTEKQLSKIAELHAEHVG